VNIRIMLIASAALIAGCDGGSSDGTNPNTTTPAVSDMTVNLSSVAQNSALTKVQCNELQVENVRANGGSDCWLLEVPEDYAKPEATKIKVAVAKLPSQREKKGAFVFLSGGPGGSAIAYGGDFAGSAINLSHDVYFVDQRGTGFSTPSLFCDFAETGTPAQLTACKNKFQNRGVDLNQYTNQFNAYDFLVLEKKLTEANELSGNWKLYGASYGTRLAMTIAREEQRQIEAGYQTKRAIEMMVLDGVLPVEVNGIKGTPWANYQSLDRLLEICNRSAPYCNEQELKIKLNEMFGRLDNQYHLAMVNYLLQKSMQRTDSKPARNGYNPVELVKLDLAEWVKIATGEMQEEFDVNEPDMFVAMSLSNICAEAPVKPAHHTAHPSRSKWGENVQNAIDTSHHTGLSFEACQTWGVKTVPASYYQAPESITYPVLLLNGANDGQTPPAWADVSAQAFSNKLSLTFDSGKHVIMDNAISDSPDCLGRLVTSAVNEPATMRTLDTRCLNTAEFKYIDVIDR
jgi:pimeloyl-ACP methyl ester carboxylesterase